MKKTNDDTKAFANWSHEWKGARKINDPEKILALWTKYENMPRRWKREIWEGEAGFRKKNDNKDKGEQCIEKGLLKPRSNGISLIFPHQPKSACQLEAFYNNLPLANQRPGQVLADAFGVLITGQVVRPIFIEVKVTDHNPWYALVQNLQQIRLGRACPEEVKNLAKKHTSHKDVARGSWGLILAPQSYYRKHSSILAKCKPLLAILKDRTRARVAFGISDYLPDGKIEIIDSNWSV